MEQVFLAFFQLPLSRRSLSLNCPCARYTVTRNYNALVQPPDDGLAGQPSRRMGKRRRAAHAGGSLDGSREPGDGEARAAGGSSEDECSDEPTAKHATITVCVRALLQVCFHC